MSEERETNTDTRREEEKARVSELSVGKTNTQKMTQEKDE